MWWDPRTGKRSSIPHHANRETRLGTLRSILSDLGITEDDLNQ
ncbi:MAG: type II toxin-antitoxin system HicA family toxin [Dehalococcoidia bacterium]|nr:type II toxin-antitoxin system HicA family toxin [Dehalococcoidia bacterium]